MTLIKSISGIRGTIGGRAGENLTPPDVVRFVAAFGSMILKKSSQTNPTVVIGRDARLSGDMMSRLVSATLNGMGIHVTDLGLSTTPTVEIAVVEENAQGGIILTASHNPAQWNALKLLNEKGEFISAAEGEEVIKIAAEEAAVEFATVETLGLTTPNENYLDIHLQKILDLPLVDVEAIKNAGFRVGVDAVNSSGGIFVPELLKRLKVETIEKLYCEPNGRFSHNPEPLPEHLEDLAGLVREKNLHLGITVDPDVDRLAFVCENGEMFGEEYTLVAVADYVLQHKPGNTVSNLSSTRALRDVTEKNGGTYQASAVGEVNVVQKMKEINAIIGGEGNGGIIYPELHYGRDALVGIALFLTHLAKSQKTMSELKNSYPQYTIAKKKLELSEGLDVDALLKQMEQKYAGQPVNTVDGVKIEFDREWVHLRKSNTEPIIRIYAESKTSSAANALADKIISQIKSLIS